MKNKWILLDVNYLAWRAMYAITEKLSYEGKATGAIFGVLREIKTQTEIHATDNVVFCFDHGKGLREQIFPGYKKTRRNKELTEEETITFSELREQIERLKLELLPEVGFKNILFQEGYEADDIIGSICRNMKPKDRGIIVSGDHDLFQLITKRIFCWNPTRKESTNYRIFREKYNLHPNKWHRVKAIAGCKSDDIIGVAGVGEATAAKYFAGTLPKTHKTYERIAKFINSTEYYTNLLLTKLPYPDCRVYEPKPQPPISHKVWNKFAESLGMKSLKTGLLKNNFGIKGK